MATDDLHFDLLGKVIIAKKAAIADAGNLLTEVLPLISDASLRSRIDAWLQAHHLPIQKPVP